MPNGRSGGFGISKDKLERMLSALAADVIIGKSVVSEVDIREMRRMVSGYPDVVIGVEEQDCSW